MENKLVEYLEGRAQAAERHLVEEHLAVCAVCRNRAEDFRTLFGALEDLPVIMPSSAFDASLRARISVEPTRRDFWSSLPSPRLAFAVAALIAVSVWMSSMPRIVDSDTTMTRVPAEADFSMIRDLPVLENYEVISKFDALSELPASPEDAAAEEMTNERAE